MAKKETKPPLPTFTVKNLGQIEEATVEFGDFTLVVGAQASGKSLFLQMFKLVIDRHLVFESLQKQGFDWSGKSANLFNLYFGESMAGIWHNGDTKVALDGKPFDEKGLLNRQGRLKEDDREESMFYIPAQRVVTMAQGWPRNFQNFDIGDPYILKSFSEDLRLLMEKEFSSTKSGQQVFPKPQKLGGPIKKSVDDSIFHGATIELDKGGLKRRFLQRIGDHELPFMTWSAGQKEFMPLLLSLYHLIPGGKKTKKEAIDWVVIEEPEMGLHPQAIQTVLLLALQLMQRGYKVVISTHSPVLLEMAWAIRNIKQSGGDANLLFKLFSINKKDDLLKTIFRSAVKEKEFRTWHFQRQTNGKVRAADISPLDAGSEDVGMSNWGGLSEFANRAVEIVSNLPEKHEAQN